MRASARCSSGSFPVNDVEPHAAHAPHRRPGQVVDDAALTAKVKASIAEEEGVSATSVNAPRRERGE